MGLAEEVELSLLDHHQDVHPLAVVEYLTLRRLRVERRPDSNWGPEPLLALPVPVTHRSLLLGE